MEASMLANMTVPWWNEVAGGTLTVIVLVAVVSLIEGFLLYKFWRWPGDRPVRVAVRANLFSTLLGILPLYYYGEFLVTFRPAAIGLSRGAVLEWWFALALVPYAVLYLGTTLAESAVIYDEARKHAGGRRFVRSLCASALVNVATYALLLPLWLIDHRPESLLL